MRILLAEDDRVSLRLAKLTLEGAGHVVEAVGDGDEAWRSLVADHERLLVTDWMMPNMDGIELVRRVRAGSFSSYVYVIIVTALDSPDSAVEGLDAGADDYLAKPYHSGELVARVGIGARLQRLERGLRDSRRQLRELATLDPATALLNRKAVIDRVEQEGARASDTGEALSVALVSLDGFSELVEARGRPAADNVLRSVGHALRTHSRRYDVIGRWGGEEGFAGIRWGGDELLLVLPGRGTEAATRDIERLRSLLARDPLDVDGLGPFSPAVSVGVAGSSKGERVVVGELLDAAVAALADARAAGGGVARRPVPGVARGTAA